MAATRRLDWIDVVRGSAVLLVILVHVMQRTELFTGHDFARLGTASIIVTPLRLPAMFLLSGVLVLRTDSKCYLGEVVAVLDGPTWRQPRTPPSL